MNTKVLPLLLILLAVLGSGFAVGAPAGFENDVSHEVIFVDVAGTSTSAQCDSMSLSSVTTTNATTLVSPMVPRTIDVVFTDANNSVTYAIVTVTGKNQFGYTVRERYVKDSTAKTISGSIPFATLTTVVASSVVGGGSGDAFAIYYGNTFGLSTPLNDYSDVFKGTKQSAAYAYAGESSISVSFTATTAALSYDATTASLSYDATTASLAYDATTASVTYDSATASVSFLPTTASCSLTSPVDTGTFEVVLPTTTTATNTSAYITAPTGYITAPTGYITAPTGYVTVPSGSLDVGSATVTDTITVSALTLSSTTVSETYGTIAVSGVSSYDTLNIWIRQSGPVYPSEMRRNHTAND